MSIVYSNLWKAYKGFGSSTTYDAQLAVVVPQAIDDFQTYTGRVVDSATFTEKHDGNGQKSLTLFNAPIASITSVTLTAPTGASAALPTTAFAVDVNSGVLKFDPPGTFQGWLGVFPEEMSDFRVGVWQDYPVFPKGHQNITVVYVGGYTADNYPAGMQGAIVQYIDVLMGQALLNPSQMALKSESLGNYSYTRIDPEEQEKALVRLFYRFRRQGGGQ